MSKKLSTDSLDFTKKLKQYKPILPLEVTQKDNQYWDTKSRITNFTILGIGYYSLKYRDKPPETMIKLITEKKGGRKFTCYIPLKEVLKFHSSKYLADELIYNNISEKRFNTIIKKIVCETVMDKFPQEITVLEAGFNIISSDDVEKSKVVFCFGNEIINYSEEDSITNNSTCKLKSRYDQKDYMKEIQELSSLPSVPPVLMISAISPYVKPLLEENQNTSLGYSVYITGETGCGKSSVCKYYAGYFEQNDNMADLSSEKRALKKLKECASGLIVADDLNKSPSSRVKNSIEAKLSDFIQQNQRVGNSIYKGVNATLNNVAFISAEYVLENPSTLNRCLIVNMEKTMSPDEHTFLEESHPKYLAFICDFIEWLCKDYHNLKTKAINEFALLEPDAKQYKGEYYGLNRVLRTKQLLDLTLVMFKQFLKDFLSIDEANIDELAEVCSTSIETCVSDTLEYIKKSHNEVGTEFIIAISEILIVPYENIVTDDPDEYLEGLKQARKGRLLPKYIFFFNIRDRCVCVKGDILIRWLKDTLDLPVLPTKQAVSKQLHHHGLLKIVGGERISKLYINGKSKDGHYHIYLDRLMEFDADHYKKTHGENFDCVYYPSWTGTSGGSEKFGKYALKNSNDNEEYDDYAEDDYDDDYNDDYDDD